MQQNNHFQCSKEYAHIIMHFTLVTVIYEMYDILNIMHYAYKMFYHLVYLHVFSKLYNAVVLNRLIMF